MSYRARLLLMALGCILALGVSAPLAAQSTRLYVANSRGDDVTVVDLGTMKVVDDIKVGNHVHGLAIQADGRRMFATVETEHTLKFIDTLSDKVIGSVKLTGKPNECAVTPDGRYVVVPIRDGNSVNIVDVAQQKIVKLLPIHVPHNAFDAGSNRYIFVSSMEDHEIDVIDLAKMEYSAHIPVGGRPRPYVVVPDAHKMYVAVSYLHGFEVVDIPSQRVTQRIEIPPLHPGAILGPFETPDTFTHGLGVTPDGTEVWVTSELDNAMYVYDLKAKKVTARVPTGIGPNWVTFSPDGKYACVSNAGSDDISVIDVRTRREVARIKTGSQPKRLLAARIPVPAVEAAEKR
jgi:YVTN family beta-propeller protein